MGHLKHLEAIGQYSEREVDQELRTVPIQPQYLQDQPGYQEKYRIGYYEIRIFTYLRLRGAHFLLLLYQKRGIVQQEAIHRIQDQAQTMALYQP